MQAPCTKLETTFVGTFYYKPWIKMSSVNATSMSKAINNFCRYFLLQTFNQKVQCECNLHVQSYKQILQVLFVKKPLIKKSCVNATSMSKAINNFCRYFLLQTLDQNVQCECNLHVQSHKQLLQVLFVKNL